MNSTVASANFIDVFAAPGDFFAGLLKGQRKTLLALLALILISSGGIYLFHSGMDPEWIVDQQLLHVELEAPSDEKEIRAFLMETAPYAGALGAIFNGIFLVIMVSILAGYYRFVGSNNEQLTYGDWFSFAVWTQMPFLVYIVGLMVMLFTAGGGDIPLTLVNYSAINQLFLHLPIGHAFYDVAEAVNLFYLWSIYLAAVGLKRWADLSTAKAWLLSALPYVLVFGLWALLSL